MSFKTISAKSAALLDQELMGAGQFSIDQLMELAGLAVAQAIFKQYPPLNKGKNNPLVLVGPGNNGGDGLVAARHLKLWGYSPTIYYPKQSKSNVLYNNLTKQLSDLQVESINSLEQVKTGQFMLIVDCLFGFSFKPPIRPPFDELIEHLLDPAVEKPPIVSVDIPSGWDVDNGPVNGDKSINPQMLVSLTAPKPCTKYFKGIHYLGGRFINRSIAEKYGITDIIDLYKSNDMIVKL